MATVLQVLVEAIKNFDKEKAVYIISNTVNNNDNASGNSLFNYYPTFNSIDKIVELYEKLVASEKEKTELLKKMMDK